MIKPLMIALLLAFTALPSFAYSKVLNDSWGYYKDTFINTDGRVIDYRKNSITTSEGQSYALLRAVMINDKKTFEKVYNWTKNNLQRKDNDLLSWLWGEKDGKYKVLDVNSATDADIDTAFALILASKKWRNPYYLSEAKKIIAAIWQYETVPTNGKRILTAGYDQSKGSILDVNPSYFAPYAFRTFAHYDKNDWNGLIDDNYELVTTTMNLTDSKLPPNWARVNKVTGEISIDKSSKKSDFSYDAIRVFYRVYLDYKLNSEKRAKSILASLVFFITQWETKSTFYTNIKATGKLRDKHESIGSIAILLPGIKVYNKEVAKEVYDLKIEPSYKNSGYWGLKQDYYGQNLVWFGYKELFDKNILKSFR